ncbi:MAG: cyclic nucleotide-binding domain-containing protein [Rhizobiaceae bacterium]
MSLDSDIKVLERVKLFEGFEPEHLRLLAFGADAQVVEEGQILYSKGGASDGGYVIVEGRIDLVSGANDGVVKQFGTGSLLGELALITETEYAATAEAQRQSQVLKISRALFRRILREYPHLAEILQKRIGASVTEFVQRLDYVKGQIDRAERQALQERSEKA